MSGQSDISEKALQRPHRAGEGRAPGQNGAERGDHRESAARIDRHSALRLRPAIAGRQASIFPEIRRPSNRAAISLAIAAIAGLGAGAANADGLVIDTNASAYPQGDVIKTGETITLKTGERLTVLDQSGEIIKLDATSGKINAVALAAEAPNESSVSALDAALWSGRRAEIGGTRADDLEACLEEAETREDLDAGDCRQAFPEEDAAPLLEVGLAVRAASLKPGDPLIFKLEANFDAVVTCAASPADLSGPPNPLGLGNGKGSLRLMQDVMAMAPQRGSPKLVAPEQPGAYRIDCRALDAETWDVFASAAPQTSGGDASALLATYASLRGAPVAHSTLDLLVAE